MFVARGRNERCELEPAANFQEEELDCHDRLLVNSAIIQGMVVPVLSKRRTNGDPFIVAA